MKKDKRTKPKKANQTYGMARSKSGLATSKSNLKSLEKLSKNEDEEELKQRIEKAM